MSIKAMTAVWNLPVKAITPIQRHVLLALADHANEEGRCWPGLKHVARKVGIQRRAVRRHMAGLVESGHLRREQRHREDGSQAANLYILVLPEMTTPPTIPDQDLGCYCPPPRALSTEGGGPNRPTYEPSVKPSVNHQEKKGVEKPTPTPSPIVVFDAWDKLGKPFPKIQRRTKKRRAACQNRLADPWWREHWPAALKKVATLPFCRGTNERGWVADIDFFLRPDTVVRLMEGKYGKKSGLNTWGAGGSDEKA